MTKQAKLYLVFLAILVALLAPAGLVIASDITNAEWTGTLRITSNSTSDASAVSTNFTANTTALIANGYINATATDAVIQHNGIDVPFMPGYDGDPWAVFVDSIGAEQNINYDFYTGNASGGKLYYFGDADGMTISDDASLELSDNGSVSIYGNVQGTGILAYKTGSLEIAHDGDNISATLNPAPELFATMTDTGVGDQLIDISSLGTIAAGDILLISVTTRAQDDITVEDFTQLHQKDQGSPGDITVGTFYKTATGGESTVNVSVTGSPYIVSTLARIVGATQIEAGTQVSTVDDSPNPPTVTASWGAFTNLFVTPMGSQDGTITVDAIPTNYSDNFTVQFGDALGCRNTMAFREYTSATDDPGVYTLSGAANWVTNTIVIGNDQGGISANVSIATTEGEQAIQVDKRPSFLGIGIDCDANTGPPTVTDNLVMNAPFWSTNLNIAAMTTVDANEYTLTASGATYSTNGRVFDGDDDVLDLGEKLSEITYSANYTIEAWVYPDNITDTGIIVYQRNDSNDRNGLFVRDSRFVIATYNGSAYTSAQGAATAAWHHVVGVCNENTLTCYVDGVLGVASAPSLGLANTAGDLVIGLDTASTSDFDGIIGEVRIYNEALTAIEAAQLFSETLWKYTGDADTYEYVYSGGNFGNNSADWVLARSGVMPYMISANITVDGSLAGSWEWEYGTTFTDDSGNGNTATPTFRTTSSNSEISAELISLLPINVSEASTFTLTSSYSILTGTPTTPDNMFTDSDYSKLPAAPINAILNAADVPQAAWWFPFLFLGISIIGMIVYGMTTATRTGSYSASGRATTTIREGQIDGSLLMMAITIEALLVLFGRMGVIPYWPVFLFPIAAIAIILSKKHYAWG